MLSSVLLVEPRCRLIPSPHGDEGSFLRVVQLFFQLFGRNTVEFLNVRTKVTVVEVAKFFADFVEIHILCDHSLGQKSSVIAEKIFRLEANGRFDVSLQLNYGESKYLSDFVDIEVVLFGKLEEIDSRFVEDAVSFTKEGRGCGRSAHKMERWKMIESDVNVTLRTIVWHVNFQC